MRCGNPTLGRFDSGAAPLSRSGVFTPIAASSSAGPAERDFPLKSAQDRWRAVKTIAQLSRSFAPGDGFDVANGSRCQTVCVVALVVAEAEEDE